MMKNTKKLLIGGLLFTTLCLLVGFGSKSVELLDSKLLIDLDKALGNGDKEVTKENLDVQNPTEETEVYQVKVSGETIWFGGHECGDTEELKKLIASYCVTKTRISLQDDFAEADTYQEVLNAIKELGINYTEEE